MKIQKKIVFLATHMLIMSETVYSMSRWETLKIKHEFKSQSATSWMGINFLNLRTGGYNTHLKEKFIPLDKC